MSPTIRNSIFRHLIHDYTEPIRDPLWQHIYLSPGIKRLVALDSFQKLGRIKQLGPAFHVYPGAVHTRLNHSLGVFHLSRMLLLALLERSEELPLTLEGVKAFLAAALLHDLGHFPYAHSLKELPLKEHEQLTAEGVLSEPIAGALREWVGCSPHMVAAIVDEHMELPDDSEVPFYRGLLSGVLDPDKLDYLNRDAFFCGVPYGMQDTQFVLHKMLPHPSRGIALESDGVTAVENVLFSKYLMYRTVYWHRAVRIATAMIKQAVYSGMIDKKFKTGDLYWLDDEEFFRTFPPDSYAPFQLIEQVMHRQLYKTAYEQPFDSQNRIHNDLTDLHIRNSLQEKIAGTLSAKLHRTVQPYEVLIDIPEPISFEVDLPIYHRDQFMPFTESGSVFSGPVVKGFTDSLRKVRIYLPEELAGHVKESQIRLL